MHALIVGSVQVGKSTLIQKVLKELNRPVWGFYSKKEKELADDLHGSPVYLYDADAPRVQTQENLVGYCKNHRMEVIREGFERFAEKLSERPSADHLIVMDEIGFMEAGVPMFCEAVISILDQEIPVIAAVKNKEIPFLEGIRSHPNCKCFYITEKNRDELCEEVLEFMKMQ